MQHQKLPRDPLCAVQSPDPKSDRRLVRRILLPEEWHWLGSTTAKSDRSYGMSGSERAALYRTAIETGLRAGEIRQLTSGHLQLKDSRPYIICHPHETKNRQSARQYVQNELAVSLQNLVSKKLPQTPVFALPDRTDMANMLRDDLADARKAWLTLEQDDSDDRRDRGSSRFLESVNEQGHELDFHSLRHTCGAWLAMTGAHPKVVQQVMRHSTITLTMDTYGHLFPGQEVEAVGRLNDLLRIPDQTSQASLERPAG